jgi:oligoendopeptidase F
MSSPDRVTAERKLETGAAPALGLLPEWNLADLYPAIDSPLVAADLARAESECAAFEQRYKGKLEAIARSERAGADFAAAVVRFEQIEELLG